VRETGKGGIGEYLCKKVKAAGGVAEKHESPGRKNVPDYLVTWPGAPRGRMHLVETKWPGGDPNSGQARDHARRARYGISVQVLDTKAKVDRYIYLVTEFGLD
jgi:hypothetical protein